MIYVPGKRTGVSSTEAKGLQEYVDEEFKEIEKSQYDTIALELRPTSQAPVRPREGMIIYPDGTIYNPSSQGSGPHYFDGVNWVKMAGAVHPTGLWTPVFLFVNPGDASIVHGVQSGHFVRIDDLVYLSFNVSAFFTHSTASGGLRIGGVPFFHASTGTDQSGGSCVFQGLVISPWTQINCGINVGMNFLFLLASGSGLNIASITASNVISGGTVRVSGNILYRAAPPP